MKYSEIVEELRISIKTVEAQMSKAYKVLRGKKQKIFIFHSVFFA